LLSNYHFLMLHQEMRSSDVSFQLDGLEGFI